MAAKAASPLLCLLIWCSACTRFGSHPLAFKSAVPAVVDLTEPRFAT